MRNVAARLPAAVSKCGDQLSSRVEISAPITAIVTCIMIVNIGGAKFQLSPPEVDVKLNHRVRSKGKLFGYASSGTILLACNLHDDSY